MKTLEFRKDNTYFDKTGKQILEGDLLKVFHFTGARRKKNYMYHVAVIEEGDFPVMSCRDYDARKPHYRLYQIVNEKRVYDNAEVINEKDWRSKRLKIKI